MLGKEILGLLTSLFFVVYGVFFYWFGSSSSLNEMFVSYWLPLLVFFVFLVFFTFYKIFTMKKPMNRYVFFKGNERMQLAMDIAVLSFIWICFFAIMGAVFFSPFFVFGYSFILTPVSIAFLALVLLQLFLMAWRERGSGKLFGQKSIRPWAQSVLAIPFFAALLFTPLMFDISFSSSSFLPDVYFATVASVFISIGLTGLPMKKIEKMMGKKQSKLRLQNNRLRLLLAFLLLLIAVKILLWII